MNTSEATKNLQQSGIRAASTRCAELGGINLGQGVCDLPIEDLIKDRVYSAIAENKSLYSPCEGSLALRQAIANKMQQFNKVKADPESEIIVTHGSTGSFVTAVTTLFNPGDEIILFEPFYGYHKNILELKGMQVATVPIRLPDLTIDIQDLKAVISNRTRGIVICTPNNPSGKVFTREELLAIGKIAKEHKLWVITDEIYEYITYPGFSHCSFASLEDFRNFSITISGFSKTYNMTGWRLGYAIGPQAVMAKMALVQDLLYVCPVTPLQHAVLAAFDLPALYYEQMKNSYLQKRQLMLDGLTQMGFKVVVPQGAYYLLADFSSLGFGDDKQAAAELLERGKVATVPGRNFYVDPEDGKHLLRFCYALESAKLTAALQAMKGVL